MWQSYASMPMKSPQIANESDIMRFSEWHSPENVYEFHASGRVIFLYYSLFHYLGCFTKNRLIQLPAHELTHWGRVTHICVSKLTIIGSDNGLPPDRRQAIIWTNAGIWLIRTLGTNFIEILGEIHSFSFKKMHLKMSSAKGRLFSFGLNELKQKGIDEVDR